MKPIPCWPLAVAALFPTAVWAAPTTQPVGIPDTFFNASTRAEGKPGWFTRAGKPYDWSSLPAGTQVLGGIPFQIADGQSGRNAILLSGADSPVSAAEVKGIPINCPGEVLYFLHAFNPGPALRQWQKEDAVGKGKGQRPLDPPVVFRYVLHYAGGESLSVNVRWNEAVNDWLRAGEYADPPYAASAWKKTVNRGWVLDGWPRCGETVTAYAFRFENPWKEKKIEAVDLVSGNDAQHDWGAPALLAISAGPREYPGTTYYAAPAGDDTNPGTFDKPWATVYKAAETLQAGDTVFLRGGKYPVRQDWKEVIVVKNSGAPGRPLTVTAYPGETAVIDGFDHHCAVQQPVPYAIYDRDRGLFNLFEKTDVIVRNLWVENSRKSGFGVYQCRNILLDHNTVFGTHHCAMNTAQNTFLRIIGNTLGKNCSSDMSFDPQTQAWDPKRKDRAGREGIDNHGNEHCEIAFNEIYYCGKEAIADPSRHFKIHHNYIHDLPHRPGTYWPSGIYLDAYGKIMDDIEVYANVIHHAACGISVGSEGGTTADNIRIHHNLIYANTWEGIGMGPAGSDGLRKNIIIENNTIYHCGHTDWEKGPTGGINIGTGHVENIIVRYNILADNRDYQVSISGKIDRVKQGVDIYENLYDPVFLPTERIVARLWGYKPVISDRLVWGNPKFVHAEGGDFTLQADSPAVDAIAELVDEDGTAGDLGALACFQTVPPPPEKGHGFVLRVDCGSDQDYTDQAGNLWHKDHQLRGENDPVGWGSSWARTVRRENKKIGNTADPELYLTERYGMERYQFGVPAGMYRVRLHFAETFHTAKGERVFSVIINRIPVLEHFDPLSAAGGPDRAVVKDFEVNAARGKITVEYLRGKDNPTINAIEILQKTKDQVASEPSK